MTNHMNPNPRDLRMPATATAMLMPWRPLAPDAPAHRSQPQRPPVSQPIGRPHTIKEISA
jgi:hypothetical protein